MLQGVTPEPEVKKEGMRCRDGGEARVRDARKGRWGGGGKQGGDDGMSIAVNRAKFGQTIGRMASVKRARRPSQPSPVAQKGKKSEWELTEKIQHERDEDDADDGRGCHRRR